MTVADSSYFILLYQQESKVKFHQVPTQVLFKEQDAQPVQIIVTDPRGKMLRRADPTGGFAVNQAFHLSPHARPVHTSLGWSDHSFGSCQRSHNLPFHFLQFSLWRGKQIWGGTITVRTTLDRFRGKAATLTSLSILPPAFIGHGMKCTMRWSA